MTVELWIASSAVDTDFTAKLIDVYPPSEDYPEGYDMLLNDSLIRTRFREGRRGLLGRGRDPDPRLGVAERLGDLVRVGGGEIGRAHV